MKTFAEMGWNPWTGVLMIYGYSVFLILLWARYAPVQSSPAERQEQP